MENNKKNSVIVYGGGIIGNLASICLKRNGFNVYQIKSNIKKSKNKNFALSPGSVNWLKSMNFQDKFFNTLYPIENIEIFREEAKTIFRANSVFKKALAYMVSEKELIKEIESKIIDEGIETFSEPKKINLVNSLDKVSIDLDNKNLNSRILIVCDGANSKIKEQLDIRKKTKNFNQNAIVFNFKTSVEILNNAKQYFLENSVLALLPISRNTVSVVWSCNQDFYQKINILDDFGILKKLKEIIGSDYGSLSNLSNRSSFPLTMVLNDKFFDKRVVLMGNAAHSIHPLAGQGLNLGIRDIIDFEKCITSSKYDDIGLSGFLRRFERSRRIDTFEFSTLTSGLQWAFSSKSKFLNKTLIKGMILLENKDSLKSFFINKAIS